MLIQLPRGPSDKGRAAKDDGCDAFEAALRRDLATAPVVSYDAILGGWAKRGFDLALVVITAPLWAPATLLVAAWAKLRHSARVFLVEERVGYGGRSFGCMRLQLDAPSAVIEQLHPQAAPEAPANDRGDTASVVQLSNSKWRSALEHLPRLLNVLRGDMSLVGPQPMAQAELEPLKTAKRHYLSARPGIVGISAIADADAEDPGHFRLYVLNWSLSVDALILWDAVRGMGETGELWRPHIKLARGARAIDEATIRRRSLKATAGSGVSSN